MNKLKYKKIFNLLLYLFDIVVILLIVIFGYKLYFYYKYYTIEKEYIAAAEYLYENNAIADGYEKKKIVLTRREINSLLTEPAIDNKCNGYVIIYPDNQGPSYEAYIICDDNYTTKGYKDGYLQ